MAYKSQVTITRPANVTAYTAGDVVGGAIQLVGMPAGPSQNDLELHYADLSISVSAIPSGMTSFRLHLYDGKPPSDIADNSAWDRASGDRASYRGYIDLGSPADQGSSLFCQVDQVNHPVRVSNDTGLWGYLVTNGAFTPAGNSEEYVLGLTAFPF